MNRIFCLLITLAYSLSVSAQVLLTEKIQDSKLATNEEKPLFLVDFWATWCAPCITAGEYLGVLQEQYADDLYILSLSKESPEVVKRFIDKHPSKLAIAIDYNGNNFESHNVQSLPWSILFDAEGNILWKGNPANLKQWIIEKFLRQGKKKKNISSVFTYQAYEYETEKKATVLSKDFELKRLEEIPIQELTYKRWNEYMTIQGSLVQIAAYLLNVNEQQIDATAIDSLTTQYELSYNTKKNNSTKTICENILRELNLKITTENKIGKILKFSLPPDEQNYWDTLQFNWGKSNPVFLIDDNEITADNISVEILLHQLANLKKTPYKIFYPTNSVDYTSHDWLVHYRYPDLMESNLADYGIDAKYENSAYICYKIQANSQKKDSFFKFFSIFKRKKKKS